MTAATTTQNARTQSTVLSPLPVIANVSGGLT